ncbi:MAG: SDR family NAD(P)-dependent oxidoreductase, partial [Cytophagaceae bacterium]|nr:SDR family NAD(P)-dependent oxidoreductase [Gemmatimonadaceae bacterium]
MDAPVAIVTGGGKRVGEAIARALGVRGMRVAVHYNTSREEAERVAAEIGNGSMAFGADL